MGRRLEPFIAYSLARTVFLNNGFVVSLTTLVFAANSKNDGDLRGSSQTQSVPWTSDRPARDAHYMLQYIDVVEASVREVSQKVSYFADVEETLVLRVKKRLNLHFLPSFFPHIRHLFHAAL